MPLLTCLCGTTIGQAPNQAALTGALTRVQAGDCTVIGCPVCGRLWVQERPDTNRYLPYALEEQTLRLGQAETPPQPKGVEARAVTVHPVRPQDFAEWLRLRCALWPDADLEDLRQELEAIRVDPRQPVFVAERPEGGLCGLIELSIHATAPGCETSPVGYIEGWYVDLEWRGQSVGRTLVQAGETWARSQGFLEMASDTDHNYPTSPQAHAALGYVEVLREIHYRKRLD
jgi:aminoglycoside 6'-N-acetyltransferase I